MAVNDTTSPMLTSLAFPDRIDVTGGSALASFTAGVSDVGTGVDHVTIDFDRAVTAGSSVFGSLTIRDSNGFTAHSGNGSFAEGSAAGDLYLDNMTAAGLVTIRDVIVTDKAGNSTTYGTAQLQALNLPTSFNVVSPTAADSSKPVLTSLTLPNVDASQNGTAFTLGLGATDSGSGVNHAVIELDHGFRSGSGLTSSLIVYGNGTSFANGTAAASGYAQAENQTSPFTIKDVQLYDNAGNVTTYSTAQLQTLGLATSFTITGTGAADNTAPVLTSLSLPATVDLSHGATRSAIAVGATETGSGLYEISLQLSRAIDLNFSYYTAPRSAPTGGPVLSTTIDGFAQSVPFYGMTVQFAASAGSYTLSVPIAGATAAGSYTVVGATLTDFAGNVSSYSASQLQALGTATSFTISGDETKPVLTALSLPTLALGPSAIGSVTFSIGGTDSGAGIDRALIHFDHALTAPFEATSDYIVFAPGSFTTGASSATRSYGATQIGSYTIKDVVLTDGGGNSSVYTTDQLQALGLQTSFVITGTAPGDFNGDAHSDILWRNSNGALSVWRATGNGSRDVIQQSAYNAQIDPSWSVRETFDFNRDGYADILWRNQNGNLSIWTGTANGFVQSVYNDTTVPSSWSIAGARDLNGDGAGDILWRNGDGALSTWLSTGSDFQKNVYSHNPVAAGWKVEGLGDFTGDGKADILWRNDDGSLSTWNSTGAGFQEGSMFHASIARSWHIDGIGDFNGDGKDDILWRNDNGAVSVWTSTGSGFAENQFSASAPTNWGIAQVGDFNADGLADIVWRDSGGALSIWHSTGSSFQQNSYFDNSVPTSWTVQAHDFPL